ncbi:hypothetical protein EVAR_100944_1 [Eumeta japonica]|uniref:Uncharacterized protein n=1 Tax=Eumeta variegata TaxID=151549 RepID=A0A4C2A3K1_EUMVA|nr:hypothetical protein EVAR_100944_1 [Eumeta japonica]
MSLNEHEPSRADRSSGSRRRGRSRLRIRSFDDITVWGVRLPGDYRRAPARPALLRPDYTNELTNYCLSECDAVLRPKAFTYECTYTRHVTVPIAFGPEESYASPATEDFHSTFRETIEILCRFCCIIFTHPSSSRRSMAQSRSGERRRVPSRSAASVLRPYLEGLYNSD